MGKNLHSIEVSHSLLFNHVGLQGFLSQFKEFLFLLEILNRLISVSNPDLGVFLIWPFGSTFDKFSQMSHF